MAETLEERKQEIQHNLDVARQAIARVSQARTIPNAPEVRLVAVSKTKPVSDILAAYECGQRHFGENVQELVEKAGLLPRDIQWHFIGTLQSNKCKAVANIPNLYAVETVDGAKKADTLNKTCADRTTPLNIFIQMNTSGEESKGGIAPSECLATARHVITNCPKLRMAGLMTIGSPGRTAPNPDFVTMQECAAEIKREMGLDMELSMGMSDDYEHAIEMGSTNVRIGSTLFGARQMKVWMDN